jgi:broad specificity phosphatase PhoE
MPSRPVTIVAFCRHGESEGNRDRRFGGHGPTPLTERGREQARATGEALASSGVDAIYASDLVRAVQTAELIGAAAGCRPETTPALRERSVGELTGRSFEEAKLEFPEAYAALLQRDADACPPGGESYAQCRQRAVAFFEDMLVRHAGQRIVLVSHHLTLHLLISHILGGEQAPYFSRVFFQIDNCALHRFERVSSELWKVVALNERAHLERIK